MGGSCEEPKTLGPLNCAISCSIDFSSPLMDFKPPSLEPGYERAEQSSIVNNYY